MRLQHRHPEDHSNDRIGWLRAVVLGANDGIVSTASLIIGVGAAGASQSNMLLTGVAGLFAGAMSMAAGEYVSVYSQADSENAELSLERSEIEANPDAEHRELAAIYVSRGLEPILADQVARQLMNHDALGAHARDELGLTETYRARPMQAAFASAASFGVGALLPLTVVAVAPRQGLSVSVSAASLIFLASLGVVAAKVGGANVLKAAWRVTWWGGLAMSITAGAGAAFGVAA